MKQTKDEIANEIYGMEFDELYAGEKAAVTRAYNKQKVTKKATPTRSVGANTIVVSIGRLGVNGMKECAMKVGDKVSDLLIQSGYTLDEQKEKINAQSTGLPVSLNDDLDNGERYIITVEIKSAK